MRNVALKLGCTLIEDMFAEAFSMVFCRLIVTALDDHWLHAAVQEMTGYSSSVIACDLECGVEEWLTPDRTPDGRPGVSLLAFGFSAKSLEAAIPNRAGQCIMTCPTTALYDGLPMATRRMALGKHLRYFGDGFQKAKRLGSRRFWRVPVMDGEFVVEDRAGIESGVGGGNILIQAVGMNEALRAARRAVVVLDDMPGVITPFPGGVARSGSKVGSRYPKLKASTADAYCPTLRGRTETRIADRAQCVLEIVIDGRDEATVGRAMRAAAIAAAGDGVVSISAGNYGGKLGKFHFHLRELMR